MATPTHYDVLEVPVNAPQDKIKEAWKKMLLKWHPDKYKGPNKEEALDKIQKINSAYATLRDADKRKQYDEDEELISPAKHTSKATPPFSSTTQATNEQDRGNFSARQQPPKKTAPPRRQNDAADAYYAFYTSGSHNFVPPMKKTSYVYRTTSPLDKLFDALQKEWRATQPMSSFQESPRVTRHPNHIAVTSCDAQRMERIIENLMLQMILIELITKHLPNPKGDSDTSEQSHSNLRPGF